MKKAKIFSSIVAFVLIAVILVIANFLTGNPISHSIAKKAIDEHIKQNYSNILPQPYKVKYDSTFSKYSAIVQSSTSVDTKFMVNYKDKKITDDYETCVLNKLRTQQRCQYDYNEYLIDLLNKPFPHKIDYARVDFDSGDTSDYSAFTLDKRYTIPDMPLPINIIVTIITDTDSCTLENIAKYMLELDTISQKHNLNVSQYSVYLITDKRSDDDDIGVYGFPVEKLNAPDLAGEFKTYISKPSSSKDGEVIAQPI